MPTPLGAPGFKQSSNVLSGDVSISGNLTVSGSFFLSGSTTGSMSATLPVADNAVARWNGTSGLVLQNSLVVIDDVGNISGPTGSASVLGTAADGGSAVGVVVGSSASYSTAGAKLLSIQNNSLERQYTDYSGSFVFNISNWGGYLQHTYFSELVTCATGTLWTTVNTIPAGALNLGVGLRVVDTFPTASKLYSGVLSGSYTKWAVGIDSNSTVTNLTSSMGAGIEFYQSNQAITISSSVGQRQSLSTTVTGSVRVEARYITLLPPQS
jgi:hypothetical protein